MNLIASLLALLISQMNRLASLLNLLTNKPDESINRNHYIPKAELQDRKDKALSDLDEEGLDKIEFEVKLKSTINSVV